MTFWLWLINKYEEKEKESWSPVSYTINAPISSQFFVWRKKNQSNLSLEKIDSNLIRVSAEIRCRSIDLYNK